MNPIEQIKNFMSAGKNPQQIAMQLIGNNKNPFINNLLKMAENGDYQGIENIARNMYKEQGRDFDKELNDIQNIMSNFK